MNTLYLALLPVVIISVLILKDLKLVGMAKVEVE